MCDVIQDENGKTRAYIFWMLHDEGGSAETDDKLVDGVYQCFAGRPLSYVDMDIIIKGSNIYESAGERGKFHVEQSRQIVFETGPLQNTSSKLQAGPNILLSSNGGSTYGTACSLKR